MKNVQMAKLMRQIVREEGYQGLFRGLVPRVAKVAPACAIMISSYEVGKAFFAGRATQIEEAQALKEMAGAELV
ncbi:hypothetical protein BC938DRAFT_474033 [Jimgerdemannia flammicorona]|uniref:Mitochondrial carrier domain-containing protein n=1 Tax=Jimgerdemannia flammicorona TaxID=994334 RepID=A0A433Q317_9FUNG|nr:hypothetical protein BC938DRAFT_474033 [Jimgerdemannia flammicorona]